MLSEGRELTLAQIRHNIILAQTFVAGMTFAQFSNDTKSFYAATRALEIISEASRRLPPDVKARHPNIPWRDMAGAGNIYRHDYEDVFHQQVWRTVVEALPPLLCAVEIELAAGDQT